MTEGRAIHKEVMVAVSPERAFRFFTENLTDWWPKDHHIGSAPAVKEIIEPRVGGRWYSINEDGSETNVGRVLVWEPFRRLVLTWQVTAAWQFDPDFVTEVEVRFLELGPSQTKVVLVHNHLERFGSQTDELSGLFDSENGWARTLGSYARGIIGRLTPDEAL